MPGTRVSDDTPPLILHVIHHLVIGGMENGVVNLINRMPPSRFRHAIACVEDYSDFRQRLTRPDTEVIALYRSRIGVWRLRRDIYRLCRRLRPAIVHTRALSGLDALLPARLAGVRHCVHGEHGWNVDNLPGESWKPTWLRRIHSPLVERYIAVSKDLQQYLIRSVGIRASRIRQIYNGVDTERFSPAASRRVDLLPENFQGRELVVFGTVGRIQAIKDQATLVKAFAELLRRHPELTARARLAIVGDGPLLPALRDLTKSLGVDALVWLPGAHTDVPEILRALDVFVLPSLAEGISNTILEGMATGLPVLATAVGGNVELVRDGHSGRLFRAGDVDALARLLAEYVVDPALRAAHASAGRQIALERFGLDVMVARYQSVYESLLTPAAR
jgi:sugar transferase (PEP-CTERM/EpsH1 system associated)